MRFKNQIPNLKLQSICISVIVLYNVKIIPLFTVFNIVLSGVLLPRICGQKKVRDEDSEHNLVSASELFARCPSLKTYLTQQLKKCVDFHHDKKLCSELVPVLSVIVKLSPPQGENE